MNIFHDTILKSGDEKRATDELAILEEIESRDAKPIVKCVDVWQIIAGEAAAGHKKTL